MTSTTSFSTCLLAGGLAGTAVDTLFFPIDTLKTRAQSQAGFLKAGGVFDYSVTLPGNWSTQGTATGDSQLLGVNPQFTVTRDFVFDPRSNTTTLEVLDTHYDPSHPNVGLDFIVFGSPVSEPLPSTLLMAGLGALGWVSRRRRAC